MPRVRPGTSCETGARPDVTPSNRANAVDGDSIAYVAGWGEDGALEAIVEDAIADDLTTATAVIEAAAA